MADITMCRNKKCILKDSCYRYNAPVNDLRQSYSDFGPENGECRYYWPTRDLIVKSKLYGRKRKFI